MWPDAELAAIWSLNLCIRSKMNFYQMCIAYANTIEVANHVGKVGLATGLEVYALRMCHYKKSSLQALELKAVVKLYAAIFCGRYFKNYLKQSYKKYVQN